LSAIEDFLTAKAAKTEAALRAYFNTLDDAPESLVSAMEYSLFAGGKRLRPALALGASEIVCGDDTAALPAACALEMIHTYSLVHDDLPSMDNDDLRRGRPTSHKVYGEAMAILAGDGLLTMAFDILSQAGDARVVGEIARAAGAAGMVGGQVIDLESEEKQLDLHALKHIHACKTGALIRGSVRAGAILGGADTQAIAALTSYGESLGLAFQIADDILDVTGDTEAMGKNAGSDEANKKATYPALLGLDRAKSMAEEASQAAIDALQVFDNAADNFRMLARFVVDRQR
jgi:geranylgeranyl diphosphate synthase, type II